MKKLMKYVHKYMKKKSLNRKRVVKNLIVGILHFLHFFFSLKITLRF